MDRAKGWALEERDRQGEREGEEERDRQGEKDREGDKTLGGRGGKRFNRRKRAATPDPSPMAYQIFKCGGAYLLY